MTLYRNGQPRTPPKPRGDPPASGFELWAWASKRELPLPAPPMDEWRRQSLLGEVWAWHERQLDMREDECWRMFGITVEYIHDERVIST